MDSGIGVAVLPASVPRSGPVGDEGTMLVSVVMPAFNAEAFIGAAISSAQAQTEARDRDPGR